MDEFLLIVTNWVIQNLKQKTHESIKRLVSWSKMNRFQFSLDKTQKSLGSMVTDSHQHISKRRIDGTLHCRDLVATRMVIAPAEKAWTDTEASPPNAEQIIPLSTRSINWVTTAGVHPIQRKGNL